MQPDELSSEAQRSTTRMAVEEEKAISTFEEAFLRIKEATGVTDVQVGCEQRRLYYYSQISEHQCSHINTFFSCTVLYMKEIAERFISQKERQQHLEKLKEENEKVLEQLKGQKAELYQQFQDMKYSGEAKLSR